MPGLKLMAELGLDGSGFEAGFHKAKGFAEGAGEGLKHFVIGAIGIGTVEEAIRRTVETAKELVETSERLGIAPEQLQVMRQAAKQSNVEFEKLAETLEKIDIARERALIPGKEGQDARRAFSALGVSGGQLHNDTAAQLFTGQIRQAVLNRNPEELGIIFRELGIKAFGKLIPLLNTNFDELGKKMKDLGAIMDAETAVELTYLSKEINLVSQIIISQFAPVLVKVVEMMLSLAAKLAAAISFWERVHARTGGTGVAAWLGAKNAELMLKNKSYDSLEEKQALQHKVAEYYDTLSDALEVFDQTTGDWDKKIEAFHKRMEEEAEKLLHPKRPTHGGNLPPKMDKKSLETPTNSLLRIGNFLGSSQALVMQINQRKVQLLQQIATNTKQRPAPRQNTFVGDAEPTFFPIA